MANSRQFSWQFFAKQGILGRETGETMSETFEERFTKTIVLGDETIDDVRAGPGRELEDAELLLQIFYRDGVREVPILEGRTIFVGRDPRNGEPIRDSSLSREHARLEMTDGEIWLRDLDSTNGTWVDGERVESAQLEEGASLAFGRVLAAVVPRRSLLGRQFGLESHESFVRSLHEEVCRAQDHRRPLTLMMFRGDQGKGQDPSRWLPRVRSRLRSYDRVALYSSNSVEVLLPEVDLTRARQLAAEIVGGGDSVRCGIGSFPTHGGSGEELLEVVHAAIRSTHSGSPVAVASTKRLVVRGPGDSSPVIASEAMRTLFELVDKLATPVIPVLIVGETGTGKEVVARALHERGTRQDKPIVAVNCGGIPSELVESTLFGHEKGAFTGANQRQEGVFEAARGGTVFLDEVGELPRAAQATLLRVLETKRVTRVGSTREIEVDVRILAATHQDLSVMADRGDFRRDLLFRLNAMTLCIPPLRERKEDVEPLVMRFIEQANRVNDRAIRSVTEDALALLQDYEWPGNVRELRNAIERAVVICGGDAITLEDLPEPIRPEGSRQLTSTLVPPADIPARPVPQLGEVGLKQAVQQFESDFVRAALVHTDWNRKDAARLLGVPLRTLSHKMQVYGLLQP